MIKINEKNFGQVILITLCVIAVMISVYIGYRGDLLIDIINLKLDESLAPFLLVTTLTYCGLIISTRYNSNNDMLPILFCIFTSNSFFLYLTYKAIFSTL